jgi:hypothetical protein
MKIVSVSLTALMMSTGMAMAQPPLQTPGTNVGTELGAGEGRRQRLQQEGGVDRQERREQRQQERAQRQEPQVERREQPLEQRQEERAAQRLEQRQEERAAPRLETRERVGEPVQIERDRAQRIERRAGDRFDERVVVRERNRGPSIRFGFGPDVFVRTLPLQYRTVIVSGRPCRITITRRVRANRRIVTTERRKCPGRPEIVIRTR